MRLPEINYGGRPESLGREDISLPARQVAATNRVLGAATNLATEVYADYVERETARQKTEYTRRMAESTAAIEQRINQGPTVYPAAELKKVGIDPGDQLEMKDYEVIGPYSSAALQKAHDAALEGVTNRVLREALEQQFEVANAKFTGKALELQGSRHREVTNAELVNVQNELTRAGDAEGALSIVDERLRLGLVTPGGAKEQKYQIHKNIEVQGYSEAIKNEDVDAIRTAMDFLAQPYEDYAKAGGVLTEPDRAAFHQRLQNQLKTMQAKRETIATYNLERELQARKYGMGDPIPISAANVISDPVRRQRMRDKIELANARGSILELTRTAPVQTLSAMRNALLNNLDQARKEGDADAVILYGGQLDVLDAAMSDRQRQIKADPAAYMQQVSPRLQELKQAIETGEAGATGGREYAGEMRALSEQFGLGTVNLLTKGEVASFKEVWQSGTLSGEAKMAILDQSRKKWGPAYPLVQQQLVREGALSGSDSVLAGLESDQVAFGQSIERGRQNEKELFKILEQADEEAGKKKSWENQILANEQLQKLAGSVPIGEEAQGLQPIVEAVRYAAMDRMHGSGVTMEDSIEWAVKEVVNFEIAPSPGRPDRTVRIPPQYDPEKITQGMRTYMDVIRRVGERPITDVRGEIIKAPKVQYTFPGLRTEDQQKMARQTLADRGYFLSTSDGRGVYLMWPDQNVQVLDENGKPLVISFDNLEFYSVTGPQKKRAEMWDKVKSFFDLENTPGARQLRGE